MECYNHQEIIAKRQMIRSFHELLTDFTAESTARSRCGAAEMRERTRSLTHRLSVSSVLRNGLKEAVSEVQRSTVHMDRTGEVVPLLNAMTDLTQCNCPPLTIPIADNNGGKKSVGSSPSSPESEDGPGMSLEAQTL
jgi:hypothetical protein